MLLDLNRYSPAVFRKEASKLGALAVPMLLAQIAQVGLGFVDTVMAVGCRGTGQQRIRYCLHNLPRHHDRA